MCSWQLSMHLKRGEGAERRLRCVVRDKHDEEHESVHNASERSSSSSQGADSTCYLKSDVERRAQRSGHEVEEGAAAAAGSAGERLHAVGADQSRELVVHEDSVSRWSDDDACG